MRKYLMLSLGLVFSLASVQVAFGADRVYPNGQGSGSEHWGASSSGGWADPVKKERAPKKVVKEAPAAAKTTPAKTAPAKAVPAEKTAPMTSPAKDATTPKVRSSDDSMGGWADDPKKPRSSKK